MRIIECKLCGKEIKVWNVCFKNDCEHLIAGIPTIVHWRLRDMKVIRQELAPIIYSCGYEVKDEQKTVDGKDGLRKPKNRSLPVKKESKRIRWKTKGFRKKSS